MKDNNTHNDVPAEFVSAVQCVVKSALLLKVLMKQFSKDFGSERCEELMLMVAKGEFNELIPAIEEALHDHVQEVNANDFVELMKQQLN